MGRRFIISYRSLVFALFVICNAIICTVGTLDLSLAQAMDVNSQLDVFMIFISAGGLLFSIPLIFVDLIWKNPVTSRVWFECSWLLLFSVLHFCGAVALSAILMKSMCSNRADHVFHNSCSSTRALLSFSWLCTIMLTSYLALLTFASITHRREDAQVWHASVRQFPWFTSRQCLNSLPNTPVLPLFHKTALPVVSPMLRKKPPPSIFPSRGGLDPEYVIEHYQAHEVYPVERPPPLTIAPPPHVHLYSAREVAAQPATFLYPKPLQSTLSSGATLSPSSPSPCLVTEWPRLNISRKPKAVAAPPSSFPNVNEQPFDQSPSGSSSTSSCSPRSRPLGPRRPSWDSQDRRRPPPLDVGAANALGRSGR